MAPLRRCCDAVWGWATWPRLYRRLGIGRLYFGRIVMGCRTRWRLVRGSRVRLVCRPAPPGGAAYALAGLRIQVLPNVVVLREVSGGRPVMVVMNCGQISPAHCRRTGCGCGSSRRGWMRLVAHQVESWGWAGPDGLRSRSRHRSLSSGPGGCHCRRPGLVSRRQLGWAGCHRPDQWSAGCGPAAG